MAKKKESKSTALVPFTTEVNGMAHLNMQAFQTSEKQFLLKKMAEVSKGLSDFARSALIIGKALAEARDFCEQKEKRMFVAFLNEIPGLAQATAYRYIQAYTVANRALPKPVLDRVIAFNIPMIGTSDMPWGKYTEIIKKENLLPPGVEKVGEGQYKVTNNSVPETEADVWIQRVQEKYAEQRGKTTGRGSRAQAPDPTLLQHQAFTTIMAKYNKLPKTKKTIKWIRDLFGYVLCGLQIANDISVAPAKSLPKDWQPKKKEEEETEIESEETQEETTVN